MRGTPPEMPDRKADFFIWVDEHHVRICDSPFICGHEYQNAATHLLARAAWVLAKENEDLDYLDALTLIFNQALHLADPRMERVRQQGDGEDA